MLLYRPVGLNELRLIYQADLRTFPPRLSEQPIFYPVLNEGYAAKIARDWNTKSESRAGFVTRFSVNDTYAGRFERRVVGSREHEELWVPAEELAEFNAHLEGPIEVIAAFFGDGFTGEVPEQGALKGKNAREQLVALSGLLAYNAIDAALEVTDNHRAIFLNFFAWEQLDLAAEGIGADEKDALLDFIRRNWVQSSRAGLRLGTMGRAKLPGAQDPVSSAELPVGQPLRVRIGHSAEGTFKLRHVGESNVQHDTGNIVVGTISGWRRVGLLSSRGDKARFFEIEPGDEEQEIAFLGFYLRGRFRVVRKENNARRAREAYKGFAPA